MTVTRARYNGIERADLEVGDVLVVVDGGGLHTARVSKPTKVTKIGKRDIVLDNGRRFSLQNGGEYGRTYGGTLTDPTDPIVAEIEHEQAVQAALVGIDRAFAPFRGHNAFTADDVAKARAALDAAEETLRFTETAV